MTREQKIEILKNSIDFRKQDIEERQIDIDNYKLSLQIIDTKYADAADVVQYRQHLEELLRTAILEQTKVKIFLEAAEINLAILEA